MDAGGPTSANPEEAGTPGSGGPPDHDVVDALYGSSQGGGSDDAAEATVSWLDIRAHAPVVCSNGHEVGHVVDVAALPEEDIFHGVVFQHHARGVHLLAPAADIAQITERAVHLGVDESAVAAYEPFQPMHVRNLGLRGVFRWKHLGWKDAPE
jgi:hypothetical protein